MGYRGKVTERTAARRLRAEGHTLLDIAERLGVAKSSVSLWVRDVPYTPRPGTRRRQPRQPNLLERRKAAEIAEMRALARDMIGDLSGRDLLIAGVALYAGEGAKTHGKVALANTNPAILAFFCRWLRTCFTIDESRLRVHLYLHEGLDLDAAIAHWSEVTGIPPEQFGKPYRAVPDGGIRNSKHEFGCATVRYSCTRTHRLILGLIAAVFGNAAVNLAVLYPGIDIPG